MKLQRISGLAPVGMLLDHGHLLLSALRRKYRRGRAGEIHFFILKRTRVGEPLVVFIETSSLQFFMW